jgi:hypothetical protein
MKPPMNADRIKAGIQPQRSQRTQRMELKKSNLIHVLLCSVNSVFSVAGSGFAVAFEA